MSLDLGVGPTDWLVLALGAAIAGFSKTAIGGAATVAVALFALLLPTRESTGVLLVLLMVGDLIAVWTYRREANWALLGRLVVPVIVGIASGGVFLARVPADRMGPVIGSIVVAMCVIEIVRRARDGLRARRSDHGAGAAAEPSGAASPPAPAPARARAGGAFFGSLAGFTTMVANAGGPVMSLYLLRSRLPVTRFVGTFAWFFFSVNLMKLPVSVGLGLVRPTRFGLILSLVPAVVAGAWFGRLLIGRIPRVAFEWTILLVALASGLYLALG
ncbi:sulfite exporter TauE/SafE family protein [Agilicoccus flavus]|uniref:sulfite exporter TauE/SafE family protein n=1 Tax=Agilicoccus flavus TaxID=2775968 RepID=UPI001CF62E40|nr:sulfite exporter TauE/SafE family protein [Agilicoccus flavus]